MRNPSRALISVFDKEGLDSLAPALARLGVELVSSGGTKNYLQTLGLPVTAVAEVTGHPEILGGRVKTLHPKIHGGILADRADAGHLAQLAEHGIGPVDLVVCNLYPFAKTVASGADDAAVIEMIDIGGPAMIRAAAKNHAHVAVVVDPGDYPRLIAVLEAGTLDAGLRRELALRAFRHTASYDAAVAGWLATRTAEIEAEIVGDGPDEALFPAGLTLDLRRELHPRYGENPHQRAAVYRDAGGKGLLGGFEKLQGKELSWNNLLDADAARRTVALFEEPAVVIVKHNNPCGVGRGATLTEAYRRAHAGDPTSAFGSIIAVNGEVELELVETMADLFVEVLTAPAFSEEALARLASKKNLRVLRAPLFRPATLELRALEGGFLAQEPDDHADDAAEWRCVTRRQPGHQEASALELAWKVVRAVKSNAIVIAGPEGTIGIGAGQMSRVDACRLAIDKTRALQGDRPLEGLVAASDAFFPFRDGLDLLARAGVGAVIQPGGSVRDPEVIAAADEQGLAMLFTGRRHFRH